MHPDDLKEVVYTMRFDEASALYAEFGPFYTGMVAPLARGPAIDRTDLTGRAPAGATFLDSRPIAHTHQTRALVAAVMLTAGLVLAVIATGAAGAEARQPEPGTAVGGQLLDDDDEPVDGVEIIVEQDDEEIGTDETDDDGRWLVEVPGAGTYAVTLDVESLPEGVGLRDPERSTLDGVRVREGQTRPVLFQLGEARSTEVSRVDRLFSLAVDGVRLGLILALCSIGLSLIFGVTGLTNFAHGELVTFGALVAFWLSASAGGPDLPFVVAAVLAVGAGAGLGFLLEQRSLRAPPTPTHRKRLADRRHDRALAGAAARLPGPVRRPTAAVRRLHDPDQVRRRPGVAAAQGLRGHRDRRRGRWCSSG